MSTTYYQTEKYALTKFCGEQSNVYPDRRRVQLTVSCFITLNKEEAWELAAELLRPFYTDVQEIV